MATEVIHVQWYATMKQANDFAQAVSEYAAPLTLKYGALKYSVMRSVDDPYRITQQIWFDDHDNWYRYWEGPEMIEFRARFMGKYQAPITYVPFREIASGGSADNVTFAPSLHTAAAGDW
jgi:quinol monooxygenase YgiN